MICGAVDATGAVVVVDPVEDGTCASIVLVSPSEFAGSFSQITSAEVLTSFSWGFGAVLFFWSLGAAIGASKRVISKL